MEVTRDYVTVVAVEGASVDEFVTVLNVGCGAEHVLVYRLPGERLGFGLKFEGGTSTSEKVRRLFIQSCAPDSPASRAHCSWGSLQEGDELLEIDSVPVTAMTRLDCVRSLKESHVVLKLLVRHPAPPPIPPRRKAQSSAVLGPPTAFADVPPEPEVYLDLLAQEEVNCLTDTGSDDTGSSISTVLGPFDQLDDETLQPPLSFQDAPLSFGDENVLPPKPAPRKDIQARFRSGKKRPPPPPPPRNDRPQCPLNVQTIAVVEMDRGDLPRLVDVVPKAFLEAEEMQSIVVQGRPVGAHWEESKCSGTGEELRASTAKETRAILACGEKTCQVDDIRQTLASNEEGLFVAASADGADILSTATENRPVDTDVVPARSENGDGMDVRAMGDGKENGFPGEEYKAVGMQNEDGIHVPLDTAGTESEENGSAGTCSNGSRPVGVCSNKDSSLQTDSINNSLLITGNKGNSFLVIGCERTDSEEISLTETGVKENKAVVTDSNCSSALFNESNGDINLLSDVEENGLSGIVDDRKGNVEMWSVETGMKEQRDTVSEHEDCSPLWMDSDENDVITGRGILSDSQGNGDLLSYNNESNIMGTENIADSPVLGGSAENSPSETDRKEDMAVPTHTNESSYLVMQDVGNSSVVIDAVDESSARIECEDSFSMCTVSMESSSVLSCDAVLTKDIPAAAASDAVTIIEESSELVTRGKTSSGRSTAVVVCQGNRPVGRGTGTDETESSSEGSSQEDGVATKPSVELECLEVPHSDSDEEDFLLNLPELELLEQGGTVFQPATGALLTASDAFFPFRYWGPTSHLATIGEDEEEDAVTQGVSGVSVVSDVGRMEEEIGQVDEDKVPAQSAESRLDNLLLNVGESKQGLEDTKEMPFTKNEEAEATADDSDATVTPSPPDAGDTAMDEAALASSASRLPPDGHEFPPNYTEHNPFTVGSLAVIELELQKPPAPVPPLAPPTRKFATEELRSPVRVPTWRKDEKSECSVKDKIAMFSSAGDLPPRFSSSEDIFLDSRPEPLPKKTPPPTLDRTHTSVDLNHTPGTHFSTLPRKPLARDGPLCPTTLSRTASLHTRSQSLIDVGRGGAGEDVRRASLNALIEQRRRGISKLRGLIIPEKLSEVVAPSHTICDLPEIRSKDSILTTSKAPPATSQQRSANTSKWNSDQTASNNTPQLVIPSPPWKSSNSTTNLPKYSPAFKRKSLTVYGSTCPSREELRHSFPSFRNSAEPPASLESIMSPTRSDLSFEYKNATAAGRHSMEDDSDNDSAVSSSRSSISPPPTPPPAPLLSPLCRTLSSETTVSAASSTASTLTCGSSDSSNRRVLKAQSVEAINRKNVLSSARYSSGRDLKVGSPLIQRKFDEDVRIAYLDVVEGPASEDKGEGAGKLLDQAPPMKPMPAPRHAPVPPKPVQRRLLEASPEEETGLLSVLTGGRGSQARRQRSKDSILGDSRRSVSVNDIRKAFEKAEMALANGGRKVNHARVSSLDSTASEDSFTPHYGSVGNLHREQFGSVTSIASSTSLISPQELQLLIEEANQPLEDSVGTMAAPVHDVVVVLLHREGTTGSIGITLAGGVDYESKEITVHKVLAGSAADRDGRIQKGDRILSINGRSMKGVTHRESLNILKAPRAEVVLVVSRSRTPQDGHRDGLQLEDCSVITHVPRPSRPPRIPEQPSETVTSPLVVTEGEHHGPPLMVMLMKDGAGLGFSLEGGKESPLGDKPLTIKKIFTGGSAEKNGQLHAGDELLSVNGSDVTILSRIEAWSLMKRLPDGPVALTVRHRLNK